MHFFSLDRGIIVVLSFVLWIGAAGLICWALVPRQLPDERASVTNPTSVVRVAPDEASAERISLAQR